MTELQAILWLFAAVFALWQIGIGVAAIVLIARGGRITGFGILPGVLFLVLAVAAILA